MGWSARARTMTAVLALALATMLGSCAKNDGGDERNVPGAARELPLKVVEEAPGLSFRFLEPGSRTARTALKRADVPEAARRWVMVYDERLPADALGAGEMVLADLTEARADGTFPARVVSTVGHEAHAAAGTPPEPTAAGAGTPAAAASTGVPSGKVILFVTSWCPHCKEAEAWFTKRGLPFTRLDVEREAGARDLLLKLFRDNAIPEQYASSVPVIAIGGKVLLGFDAAEVAKALQGAGAP